MADETSLAPVGEWGALQAAFSRADITMCTQLVTRASADDFQVREFRGWAWQLAARLLADPKTPRRNKLKLVETIVKRTDPEPKGVDELDRLRAELASISQRGFTLNVAIITSDDAARAPHADSGTIRVVAREGDGP